MCWARPPSRSLQSGLWLSFPAILWPPNSHFHRTTSLEPVLLSLNSLMASFYFLHPPFLCLRSGAGALAVPEITLAFHCRRALTCTDSPAGGCSRSALSASHTLCGSHSIPALLHRYGSVAKSRPTLRPRGLQRVFSALHYPPKFAQVHVC